VEQLRHHASAICDRVINLGRVPDETALRAGRGGGRSRRLRLFLATVAVVIGLAACAGAGAAGVNTAALPWQSAPRSGDSSWIATHETLLRSVPAADPGIIFVGDSILFAWLTTGARSWTAFSPWRPANLGVPGDTTQNVLWRIDHGEVDHIHPKVATVMIGTNDLGHYSATDVARGVEAVVSDVAQHLPGTKVLLLGILPIDKPDTARHAESPKVNRVLANHYADGRVQFLDLGPSFLTPAGNLRADLYHSVCLPGGHMCGNLVHPSAAGYTVMAAAVQPVVRALAG
jgi:beta-glucosidase